MLFLDKLKKRFAVAVELGRPADGTVISVVEQVKNPPNSGLNDHTLEVRHVERIPQGTSYQEIADRVLEILNHPALNQSKTDTPYGPRDVETEVLLVFDQTVVSSAIVKMIQEKVKKPSRGARISGSHTEGSRDAVSSIPKQELVGLIEARLETAQLKFSKDLPETNDLVEELIKYRQRKTTHVVLTADPWREQPSEDLVFAVALACWVLQEIEFSYEFLW